MAGKIVQEDGSCGLSNIPNCNKVDEKDPRKCEECNFFYSANPARTACVSCLEVGDGCLTCGVDRYNKTTKCTSCIANMELKGKCEFDGCEED